MYGMYRVSGWICTEYSIMTVNQLVDLGAIPDHYIKNTPYGCRAGKDLSISKWFGYFIHDRSRVSASLKFSLLSNQSTLPNPRETYDGNYQNPSTRIEQGRVCCYSRYCSKAQLHLC